MKDVYEVLREKESQIEELQKEVEALKIAARLLTDESDREPAPMKPIAAVLANSPAPAPRLKNNGHAASWDATTKQFP